MGIGAGPFGPRHENEVDRAPLIEAPATDRLSLQEAPDRVLPLRLTVIA